MVGLGDEVGQIVCRYLTRNADRAYVYMGDDVSRAIGRRDWLRVEKLERAKLRLLRLHAVYGLLAH